MTAPAFDLATTVRRPPDSAALQAADRALAAALESARADSTNRVYRTQWRSFSSWCSGVGLRPLPADPLTVARYLGVRSEAGVSMATLHQAASAITRVHEWLGAPSPCQDPGVRESLKGWARRLARPQRQAGALTSDVLGVIRLTAGKPRPLGRGTETLPQAAARARFDVALVAVLSDAGLRRSEAAALTWGDVERWADGSGRITVVSSKTDVTAQGAVVAITPAAVESPGRHPAGGRGQGGEGVRVVGIPDRPAGEGAGQGCRPAGLEELQRPQRPGGHGPAHGPEQRAHPRDRTPGPLEAGRRHGRPLHQGRIRRVGFTLPVTHRRIENHGLYPRACRLTQGNTPLAEHDLVRPLISVPVTK